MKTTEKFLFNFHLFDGEGAGRDASTAASEQGKSTERTEYGRPKGNEQQGQVGTDTKDQGENLEAEFAELISKGGRFHDIYGKKVSDTVQERFKNQTDLQAQVDSITEGLSPLFMNYGLKEGEE